MKNNSNLDFTLPTVNQLKSSNLLKYRRQSNVTDFAVLLGCEIKFRDNDIRKGICWSSDDNNNYDAIAISPFGVMSSAPVKCRNVGFRPILPYSEIKSMVSNAVKVTDEIFEVEYGEYPQTTCSFEENEVLEKQFGKFGGVLNTGKTYTTDLVEKEQINIEFQPRKFIEYEYQNKKYIRFLANQNMGETLSTRCEIIYQNPYWIKVEPVKWLVNERTNIAIIKDIIVAGIQFNNERNYKGDFNTTNAKKYLDTYFSKEIIPSNKLTKEKGLSTESQAKLEQIRNPYKFDFDEVSEEEIIKGAIESGIAVFLHGLSSEGKSARVKQIDSDCIIIYLRNATPESLNGKSVYNQETGEMIDVKPTWLKKLEEKCNAEPDKNHIVFFDEISNALPSIQGIAFNIVLDREVNGIWKLPENARIVAAGNDMKDSLAANQIAEPLFNRFAHVYIKTTTESWLKWASENNIHPAIYILPTQKANHFEVSMTEKSQMQIQENGKWHQRCYIKLENQKC